MNEKTILITGTSGFIGFHLAKLLLDSHYTVIGVDGMTNYYDVNLKKEIEKILKKNKNFFSYNFMLEDLSKVINLFNKYKPNFVVHLAHKARYSIENPSSYIQSNNWDI